MGRLTSLQAKNAKSGPNGKLALFGDGDDLWLTVQGTNHRKTWALRYASPITRKQREMGLGSESYVSLAEARDAAWQAHNTNPP